MEVGRALVYATGAAALAYAVHRLFAAGVARGASLLPEGSHPKANTLGYSTVTWDAPVTAAAIAAGIPPVFAKNWLAVESGGNPCAVGKIGARGPDGYPLEIGIGQLFNPDDLHKLGITSSELRAYCSADPHRPEDVTRHLTPVEVATQVHGLVGKIVQSRSTAMQALAAIGVRWPSIDTWRLTKLVHGLPGLVHGLSAVTAHLGHSPSGWGEFRAAAMGGAVRFDPKTEAYRPEFGQLFLNAEKMTRGMADGSSRIA